MPEIVTLILIGVLAGVVSGLLGVGGGVVFVPGLVIFVGLTQHVAEGTSLLAIIPAVLVGAASQRRYGNVKVRDAILMGCLSIGGAAGGVVLANALPAKVLRTAFAVLLIAVTARILSRALRRDSGGPKPLQDEPGPLPRPSRKA